MDKVVAWPLWSAEQIVDALPVGTGDGDVHEVVKTLQAQAKQVILWTTRRPVSESYGGSLRGPGRLRIEWLEDLIFGAPDQAAPD